MHTPNIFDQTLLKFTSGNSVPVDRVFITREEFIEMHKEYDNANRRILMLIDEVARAAHAQGIIHENAIVDGPTALMLLEDMVEIGVELKMRRS